MPQDREDEPIFKIDTVPPPAGESDAYSAPTRVGPMLSDQWAELMKAEAEGLAPPKSGNEHSTSPPSAGAAAAKSASKLEDAASALAPQPLPKIPGYREDEDDDGAATMLHRGASPSMRDTDLADPMFGLPESARAPTVEVPELEGGGPFSTSLLGGGQSPAWQPREIAMAVGTLIAVAVIGGIIALFAFGH